MPWLADVAPKPTQIERLASGAVRVTARLARDGVQEYPPHLFAESKDWPRPVRVYRPPAAVFAPESIATLADIPITVGHPREGLIDGKAWGRYVKGNVSSREPRRVESDGADWIEAQLVVHDSATADRVVESKELSEISQGYHCDFAWTPGKTEDGEEYDVIVSNIIHNHTALLEQGEARAGTGARILVDSTKEDPVMNPEQIAAFEAAFPELKGKLTAETKPGDIPAMLEAAKAEKAAADKAEADKAEADKKVADAAKAEADKKAAELAKGDPAVAAAVAEAQKVATDAKTIADSVANAQARRDAIEQAKPMLPPTYVFDGKSAREIKLAAIKQVAPKLQSVTDKSNDAAVDAVFATFVESKTRYVADKTENLGDSGSARDTYRKNMRGVFVSGQKSA